MTSVRLNEETLQNSQEYVKRCQSLKIQIYDQITIKKNLMLLNKRNENISQSLVRMRKEYEALKLDLQNTLFHANVTSEKQKILTRKALDGVLVKRKFFEEQYKKSPFIYELEKLIEENNNLQEQCMKITVLFQSTKKEYNELMENLLKTFQMKVCELCNIILKMKSNNYNF